VNEPLFWRKIKLKAIVKVSEFLIQQKGKRKEKKNLSRNLECKDPNLVDPEISFKTAIWFWMTPQSNKPFSQKIGVKKKKPIGNENPANN
jgi:hypothetical protein